jgi:hypothetical protein
MHLIKLSSSRIAHGRVVNGVCTAREERYEALPKSRGLKSENVFPGPRFLLHTT